MGVDVQAYTDASASQTAEMIPADEVLTILKEEQGYFKVLYDGREVDTFSKILFVVSN